MKHGTTPTWLVLGLPHAMNSGGTVRAGRVFADLCARQQTIEVRGRSLTDFAAGLLRHPRALKGSRCLVSSRAMPDRALRLLSRAWRPIALDVHDHPTLQSAALGLELSAREIARADASFRRHVDTFEVLIAQTASFAGLAGLPPERTFLIPNGTDPERFMPGPVPTEPVVALVSGANSGRGIESLVEAVRRVRGELPSIRLRMGLSATSAPSAAYLATLREVLAAETWIEITSLSYEAVPAFLDAASIVAVPHPPGAYMDAVLPVKLADALASGRPVVSTPRTETASVLRRYEAGEVAAGDHVDDLAASILALATDPDRAAAMGRTARVAAIEHFAWQRLSNDVTEHVTRVASGPP